MSHSGRRCDLWVFGYVFAICTGGAEDIVMQSVVISHVFQDIEGYFLFRFSIDVFSYNTDRI